MNLIDEVVNGAKELRRNVDETERLLHSLIASFEGREFMNNQTKEQGMDSIRDALIQSADGRKLVIDVNDEMRRKAIERETARAKARQERQAEFDRREAVRGRIRTLKDLVHYTFVAYPKENNRPVRFDIYRASKDYVRDIAAEGGEKYEKLTRTLQFAPTSKSAFQDAVLALSEHEHDFNSYDSSDALQRHAA